MLSHKSYFSNVPCPDNEEGGCIRPYCQFFHKFKSSKSKKPAAPVPEGKAYYCLY